MADVTTLLSQLRTQLDDTTAQINAALARQAALEHAIGALEALEALGTPTAPEDATPAPCPSPGVSSSSSSSPKKESRKEKKKRGENGSTQPGTQQGAVLEALCSLGGAGRPVELQRITGLPRTRVATSLTRLGREGLVQREGRGVYLPTEAGRVWVSRHRTAPATQTLPEPLPRRAPTPVPGGPRKKERWDGVERGARVVLEDTPAPHVAVAIGTVQYGQGGYALELNGELVCKADGVTPEWWPGLGELSRAVRRLLRERGEEVAA